jgi:hypothetical protein
VLEKLPADDSAKLTEWALTLKGAGYLRFTRTIEPLDPDRDGR